MTDETTAPQVGLEELDREIEEMLADNGGADMSLMRGMLTTRQLAERWKCRASYVTHLLETKALAGVKLAPRVWGIHPEAAEQYEKFHLPGLGGIGDKKPE